MASIDLLANRVDFKLYASQLHVDRFRALITPAGTLAASTPVRVEAELELDEFFYQSISTLDSLLQEINVRLNIGLPLHLVDHSSINRELKRKNRAEITTEINVIHKHSWLELVSELHNHSKHRAMISKAISVTVGDPNIRESLIDPRTNTPIEGQIIDYLEASLTNLRELVRATRAKL